MKKKFIIPCAIFISVFSIGTIVSCQKQNNDVAPMSKSYSADELYAGVIFARGRVATQIPEYKDIQDLTNKIKGSDQIATDRYVSSLISKINNYYPGYLNEFKEEILSKDYIRVDAAMKKATDITTKTVFLNKLAANTDPVTAKNLVQDALVKNPGKFDQLMNDIRKGEIDNTVLQERIAGIFGKDFKSNLRSSTSTKIASQDDECLAINIALVINVVAAINLALMTNIEAGVNIHFAVNITNEVGDRMSSNSGLKHEQLISSIVNNI